MTFASLLPSIQCMYHDALLSIQQPMFIAKGFGSSAYARDS